METSDTFVPEFMEHELYYNPSLPLVLTLLPNNQASQLPSGSLPTSPESSPSYIRAEDSNVRREPVLGTVIIRFPTTCDVTSGRTSQLPSPRESSTSRISSVELSSHVSNNQNEMYRSPKRESADECLVKSEENSRQQICIAEGSIKGDEVNSDSNERNEPVLETVNSLSAYYEPISPNSIPDDFTSARTSQLPSPRESSTSRISSVQLSSHVSYNQNEIYRSPKRESANECLVKNEENLRKQIRIAEGSIKGDEVNSDSNERNEPVLETVNSPSAYYEPISPNSIPDDVTSARTSQLPSPRESSTSRISSVQLSSHVSNNQNEMYRSPKRESADECLVKSEENLRKQIRIAEGSIKGDEVNSDSNERNEPVLETVNSPSAYYEPISPYSIPGDVTSTRTSLQTQSCIFVAEGSIKGDEVNSDSNERNEPVLETVNSLSAYYEPISPNSIPDDFTSARTSQLPSPRESSTSRISSVQLSSHVSYNQNEIYRSPKRESANECLVKNEENLRKQIRIAEGSIKGDEVNSDSNERNEPVLETVNSPSAYYEELSETSKPGDDDTITRTSELQSTSLPLPQDLFSSLASSVQPSSHVSHNPSETNRSLKRKFPDECFINNEENLIDDNRQIEKKIKSGFIRVEESIRGDEVKLETVHSPTAYYEPISPYSRDIRCRCRCRCRTFTSGGDTTNSALAVPSAPVPSAPLPSAPLPSAPLLSAPLPSAPLPSEPLPSADGRGSLPSAPLGNRKGHEGNREGHV